MPGRLSGPGAVGLPHHPAAGRPGGQEVPAVHKAQQDEGQPEVGGQVEVHAALHRAGGLGPQHQRVDQGQGQRCAEVQGDLLPQRPPDGPRVGPEFLQQPVAGQAVGHVGELLDGQQRRADQQEQHPQIAAEHHHHGVAAEVGVLHHPAFGVPQAAVQVGPQRRQRPQRRVRVGVGAVLGQQHGDAAAGQPLGHRVGYDEAAPVVVADLGHIPAYG